MKRSCLVTRAALSEQTGARSYEPLVYGERAKVTRLTGDETT